MIMKRILAWCEHYNLVFIGYCNKNGSLKNKGNYFIARNKKDNGWMAWYEVKEIKEEMEDLSLFCSSL